jgi:hypothetical protein
MHRRIDSKNIINNYAIKKNHNNQAKLMHKIFAF